MMDKDIFAEQPFGKAALKKIAPTSPNFRLYYAGWLETGGPPETWDTMEVKGGEFRIAKTGPKKGKLSILVPGTVRTAYIHKSEMID